jgi:hypothetical protein
MNIDLLPFTAFELQSCGAAGQDGSAAQTLTLQLAPAPVHSSREPMSGKVSTNQAFVHRGDLLRAAVVPADSTPLTITF